MLACPYVIIFAGRTLFNMFDNFNMMHGIYILLTNPTYIWLAISMYTIHISVDADERVDPIETTKTTVYEADLHLDSASADEYEDLAGVETGPPCPCPASA